MGLHRFDPQLTITWKLEEKKKSAVLYVENLTKRGYIYFGLAAHIPRNSGTDCHNLLIFMFTLNLHYVGEIYCLDSLKVTEIYVQNIIN